MDTTTGRAITRTKAIIGVAVAAGMIAAGCASDRVQETRADAAAAPVSVICGPAERALVRPTIVNGVQGSQVTCVAAGPGAAVPVSADAPLTYDNGVPVATPTSGYVPAGYQYPVATREPVATRPVYVEPVRRTAPARRHVVTRGRSVGKSALIIGGSAGAGAGIGAAIGGKKGALIGALVGGGGATLWDQITRHTGGR